MYNKSKYNINKKKYFRKILIRIKNKNLFINNEYKMERSVSKLCVFPGKFHCLKQNSVFELHL